MPGTPPVNLESQRDQQPDPSKWRGKCADEPIKLPQRRPIHRYFDGRPFSLPKQDRINQTESAQKRQPNSSNAAARRGQTCRSTAGVHPEIADSRDWKRRVAVVDPCDLSVNNATFKKRIRRELKIRNYAANTVKSYSSAIGTFLDWAGIHFSRLTREHVREYLEFMVDAGLTGTTLGIQLTAIRTCFDKFCLTDITLGLATPRRPKKSPVVLSKNEIVELLEAAISLRDKLLLGLMYATGMRVSEVARVKFKDIDFDRNLINIWHAKHAVDRQVALPQSYRSLLRSLAGAAEKNPYLFPSEQGRGRKNRHLSPRTIQRVLERTLQMTGIKKPATPHSLRHSFATHCFENGCDIRRIQKVLGHANLETTTIYVHVAKPADATSLPSPIDGIDNGLTDVKSNVVTPNKIVGGQVGRLKVHTRTLEASKETQVTVEVFVNRETKSRIYLTGILAIQQRPGFWTLRFPPLEHWHTELNRLPKAVQMRVAEASFYEGVRNAIVAAL